MSSELFEPPDENQSIPDDFNFPFTPYDIQKDFMRNLYAVIKNRKIGIFESVSFVANLHARNY